MDVSEFIVENGIRSTDELFAVAKQRQQEANKDLANFVIGRCVKKLRELVGNTWAMETSRERLARVNMSRMETVQEAADGDCVEGCQGEWYNGTFGVLTNNGINPVTFAAALRHLLQNSRGKYCNIIIVGPAKCGETFMLSPLQILFKTFSNPANDKHARIGADEAECIFLNDFC